MENNRTKKIALNTLLLIFCCVIIALFCLTPNKVDVKLDETTYKVNFDSDGGTAIVAIEVPDGSTIERPEDPTREGYEFVGWMLGDELYDFSYKVDKDITLKAYWQELKPDVVYYTVTFDSGGGTPQSNQIIEAGQFATKPIPDPVKENFTFEGWKLNGNDFNFATPINSDITLVAGWKENEEEKPDEQKPDEITYTVTFNSNGGSAVASQTIKDGENVKRPKNPTRSGYTFKGWYTSLNGSKTFNFSTKITKNTTIYAQWTKNSSGGGGGNSGGNSGGTTPQDNDPEYTVRFESNYPSGSNMAAKNYTMKVKYSNNVITSSRPSQSTAGFSTPTYYAFNGWNDSASATSGKNLTITKSKTVYAIWKPGTLTTNCYVTNLNDRQCMLEISYGNSILRNAYVVISNDNKYTCSKVNANRYGDTSLTGKINGYNDSFSISKKSVSVNQGKVESCGG